MFFWSAPTAPIGLIDLPLTLLVYSLASAAALSAVLLTKAQGLPAAFLGGCIMGWLVEGVVVATTFEAFPFQLVWTPMAWHGLITGAVLVGVWRWAVAAPLRLAATIVALVLFGAAWAQYWPLERSAMPSLLEVTLYLAGLGLLVPVGHIVLDRLDPIETPPRWLLATPPVLFALVWLVQLVLTLDPTRLALPVAIGLATLAMRGTGRREPSLRLHPASRPLLHWVFLLVPLGVAISASWGWSTFGGLAVNGPIAIATSVASVAIFAVLLGSALWRRRTRKAPN